MSILTSLRRAPKHPSAPAPKPAVEPKPTSPVIARFLTLGGAEVAITRDSAGYRWECRGCGRSDSRTSGSDNLITLWWAQDTANGHAAKWRCMPKTDGA